MTVKPMGRGTGIIVQSFQQHLSSTMQLDNFDQHVRQAKHGNQVPNPRKIHSKIKGNSGSRERAACPSRLTKMASPKERKLQGAKLVVNSTRPRWRVGKGEKVQDNAAGDASSGVSGTGMCAKASFVALTSLRKKIGTHLPRKRLSTRGEGKPREGGNYVIFNPSSKWTWRE